MPRKRRLMSLDEMREGMHVRVLDLHTFRDRMGYILKVNRSNQSRMIDGKPVKSNRVESVIIELNGDENVTISASNLDDYQITTQG